MTRKKDNERKRERRIPLLAAPSERNHYRASMFYGEVSSSKGQSTNAIEG